MKNKNCGQIVLNSFNKWKNNFYPTNFFRFGIDVKFDFKLKLIVTLLKKDLNLMST